MTLRCFIALIPPQEIQDYADRVIQELTDRYKTRTAKAPPHIKAYFSSSLDRSAVAIDRI